MKVKICGIRKKEDIDIVNKYKPDYIGMVLFFEKSKRCIDAEEAKMLLSLLSDDIIPVAVTVVPTLEQVKTIEELGFKYIQIHGDIDEKILTDTSIKIIKAFNVTDMDDIKKYGDNDRIKGFVFDSQTPGSGKTFDWNITQIIPKETKPWLLAGGLGCENVKDAIKAFKGTNMLGVDVSSAVENEDGSGKDESKVKEFIYKVKNG